MRKLMSYLGRLAVATMFTLSVVSMAAFALTVPPTFSPRQFVTQQTGYIRVNVTITGAGGISANGVSCTLVSNACSVKVGAVPYNSFIVRGYQQILTSFNSASTDLLGIGTTTAGVNLVAAQSVHGAAGGSTALTIVAANAGLAVTGNGIASTGTDGGFDIYVNYSQTGTAASAGQAILVLEYFAPNDGTCVDVPLGSTGVAC